MTTTNDSGVGSERVGMTAVNNGDRLVFNIGLNNQSLSASGPLSVSHSITLLDQNGITLTDSHVYTLAKALTIDWAGSLNMTQTLADGVTAGSLFKTGLGALTLSGANTFTGGTTINGGTLSLLNDNALGAGTLTISNTVSNPTLTFGNNAQIANSVVLQPDLVVNSAISNSSRLSGLISESGGSHGLNFTGDGTLVFSHANTFTGGIYVTNNGTLRAEDSNAFGTGSVHASGGMTLDLASGVNLSNGFLLSNNIAANVSSGAATLSGIISETGASQINKTGAGTLILDGANTYTGTTTVSGGELQVNNSIASDVNINNSTAMLSGSGSVGNVINNGIVQPGTSSIGTLNINGDFTQSASGTTQIRASTLSHDYLNISGQAGLNGTLKIFEVGGGHFNPATTYKILDAASGIHGTYSSVVSNLSMFTINVIYDPNDVKIQLTQTSSLMGSGTTMNQVAVGTALDTIALTSSGSLFNAINTLGAESTSGQQQSLEQLSAGIFGSTQTLGLQAADQFQFRLTTRMVSNGRFLVGSPPPPTDSEEVRGQSPSVGSGAGGWIQGFGVGGGLHSDGNGAGVRYSQGGGLYGADLAGDETGVIGVAGGTSYVGFHDADNAGGQLTAYQVGLYGLKQNEIIYALGTLMYGYDDYGSARNVGIGGVNEILRGHFAGHQLGAYAETGIKYHYGWVHLQPLAGLQYLYLAQQGFSESGGPAALNVSANQANSLRANFGARLIVDQLIGRLGAVWTPYWHARWVTELADNDQLVTASFVGSPIGGAFTTHGTQLGTNYCMYGKGVQVQLNEKWSLFGSADLLFGGRIQSESGSLGALYLF